jgi:hypothetical protein
VYQENEIYFVDKQLGIQKFAAEKTTLWWKPCHNDNGDMMPTMKVMLCR